MERPSARRQQERRLGLGAGETELARIPREPPCRLVPAEACEALGDVAGFEPFDGAGSGLEECRRALRSDELDGARAVFADCADQSEGVAWRHLKTLPPPREDGFVVRQQPPEPRLDSTMLVLGDDERH